MPVKSCPVLPCPVAVQDDWFPFFACIEDAASKGVQPDQVEGVTHGCAVHAGLVPSKLMDCYKGEGLQGLTDTSSCLLSVFDRSCTSSVVSSNSTHSPFTPVALTPF